MPKSLSAQDARNDSWKGIPSPDQQAPRSPGKSGHPPQLLPETPGQMSLPDWSCRPQEAAYSQPAHPALLAPKLAAAAWETVPLQRTIIGCHHDGSTPCRE